MSILSIWFRASAPARNGARIMTTASDGRFWSRNAKKYAKGIISDPAGYERTLEQTRRLMKPNHRVLELGCGTGTTALRLAGDARTYDATDISPEMIAIAEDKHMSTPIAGLTFRTATVDALPLDDGQVDMILGFNYLHLVRDLPGTLEHIHAILAPHGLFISKTPCLGNMNSLIGLVLLPMMRAMGKAPHAGVFSAAELAQLMEATGFNILAMENHASRGDDHRPYIVACKQ